MLAEIVVGVLPFELVRAALRLNTDPLAQPPDRSWCWRAGQKGGRQLGRTSRFAGWGGSYLVGSPTVLLPFVLRDNQTSQTAAAATNSAATSIAPRGPTAPSSTPPKSAPTAAAPLTTAK